jgi:hypothetical protein
MTDYTRMTTPSALSKVASQHFLDAQPPLLFQEGTTEHSFLTRFQFSVIYESPGGMGNDYSFA